MSLHLSHRMTSTELSVAEFKTKVVPPRKDKVISYLTGFSLMNKVAVLRKEENYCHKSPRKSPYTF